MPIFTTFTIFEDEIRQLILAMVKDCHLDKNNLTDWLYSEGIMQLRAGQGPEYYSYVKENIDTFGHRPLISIMHSRGQLFSGLLAVKKALIKHVASDNAELSKQINTLFNGFITSAIEAHLPFITVQSKVHSELNATLDKNGDLPPIESLALTIEFFENKRSSHPALETDFKNQITLMKEFLDWLKQNPSHTSKSPVGPFFSPEQSKAPAQSDAPAPQPK